MFCASCGNRISDTAKFCSHCGATVLYRPNEKKSDTKNTVIGEKEASASKPIAEKPALPQENLESTAIPKAEKSVAEEPFVRQKEDVKASSVEAAESTDRPETRIEPEKKIIAEPAEEKPEIVNTPETEAPADDPEVASTIGATQQTEDVPYSQPTYGQGAGVRFEGLKSNVKEALNAMTGDSGEPTITFKQLFADVLQKHNKRDLDNLLVSGTFVTEENKIQWGKPWLFFRFFAVLAISFLILLLCSAAFNDTATLLIPAIILLGSLAVPASLMIFFWETNEPRNISLFEVIKIFFVGGAISCFLVFIIQPIVDTLSLHGANWGGYLLLALIVGISEEIAKLIAVCFFARKIKGCWILNGLLVGAIVGAGFDVFETAGYTMQAADSLSGLSEVIFQRGIFAAGSHVIWTAIAGAAVMMVQGSDHFDYHNAFTSRFLKLFAIPVGLHSLWDFFSFSIDYESQKALLWILLIILSAIGWVFIVKLINSGLKEFAQGKQSIAENPILRKGPAFLSGYSATRPQPAQSQSASFADYQKYPHPYHKLGGWLLFLVISFFCSAAVAGIYIVVLLWSAGQVNGWLGYTVISNGQLFFAVMLLLYSGGINIVYSVTIIKKNPKFMRYYEILQTISIIGMFVIAAIASGAFIMLGIVYIAGTSMSSVVVTLLWMMYFRKSVRVRTYMGSEAYLRQSIYFKNAVSPIPADMQPEK